MPADGPRRDLAPPRGPIGLSETPPAADPTQAGWDGRLHLAAEHLGSMAEAEADAAYRMIAHAVRDRDVLDLGCGAGHGAMVLAAAGARSVLGVDPDARAVEMATRLYGADARFLQAEPLALPLAPASFDVAVCLEPAEDASQPESLAGTLRRVLTDDGIALLALPVVHHADPSANGNAPDGGVPEAWRTQLSSSFRNVRLYRRRTCLGAAIAPIESVGRVDIDETSWITGGPGEDRGVLALASDAELPDLPPVASLTDFRDLRAYRATVEAWEDRARNAEADGSAKHWELVAAREAQRRLRKRLYELEHRPMRVLWRVMRGGPRRIGKAPPVRASERGPESWD